MSPPPQVQHYCHLEQWIVIVSVFALWARRVLHLGSVFLFRRPDTLTPAMVRINKEAWSLSFRFRPPLFYRIGKGWEERAYAGKITVDYRFRVFQTRSHSASPLSNNISSVLCLLLLTDVSSLADFLYLTAARMSVLSLWKSVYRRFFPY